MTDDFIRQLQADWRAQPVDKAVVVGRLKRGRWTPRVLLWLELLQVVIVLVGGVVFLWLALDGALLDRTFATVFESRWSTERAAAQLQTIRAIFAVSGVVMFAALPLAWAAVRARWGCAAPTPRCAPTASAAGTYGCWWPSSACFGCCRRSAWRRSTSWSR
jgi:hypothetical protein